MTRGSKPKIGKKADNRPSRELVISGAPSALVSAGPPMPTHLPADVADNWHMICRSLPGLNEGDLFDVEMCVRSMRLIREIDALVDEIGLRVVIEDMDTGRKVSHVPEATKDWLRMRKSADDTYRYHADQLGLSRMSRARMNVLDIMGKSELVSLAERVEAMRHPTKAQPATSLPAAAKQPAPAKKPRARKATPKPKPAAK